MWHPIPYGIWVIQTQIFERIDGNILTKTNNGSEDAHNLPVQKGLRV
jgi:hypothetical protein